MKKKKDYEENYCPICGHKNVLEEKAQRKSPSYKNKEYSYYECPRCGDFFISYELDRNLQSEQKPLTLISSWIREQNEIGREVSLTTEAYERLKKDLRMPSVSEKQFKLMQALERRTRPGKWIDFRENKEALIAAGWCTSLKELIFWIKTLIERKLLKEKGTQTYRATPGGIRLDGPSHIQITGSGWDYLDEYKRRKPKDSKKAFIAMWFDKRMDSILDNAIYPAVEEAGYEPIRIDRVEHIDKVDDKIIAEIRSSKFVIADLTKHRNGVYFEAGFALGLGIPVVWCVREDQLEKAHFDVSQFNLIIWENEKDLKEKLLNRIKAVIV
ncbi:MAG TPA: hypothetical protein ENF30_01360 [Candidatus Desulfofervidus auxilii]|uniref:Nucleoside 2-deoxyribosyltransferase n=1 Tax=Desulfofervidus auxilii TaxID=1621989 RepID=A0A7V0IA59_DESA2|nr:hypothetical protein [Candidatus Desulfofervidus auxilii]